MVWYAVESGLIKPDVVLYLNIHSETAAERKGFGQERYETTEMQQWARSRFKRMMKEDSARWEHVDAHGDPDDIATDLAMRAQDTIIRSRNKPIEYF